MVSKTMFSSASSEWETPPVVYNYLNHHYRFRLDPCATKDNHKCDTYFTKETDGLTQNWHQHHTVFMNPVYGNPLNACEPNCAKKTCKSRGYHIEQYVPGIEDWMTKAFHEAQQGSLVACLVPARTDTAWFHKYCMTASEVWFVRGRLSFINRVLPNYNISPGHFKVAPAPFPSAIVILDGRNNQPLPTRPLIKTMTINKLTNEISVV